jgi:hypothetical protein
MFDSGTESSRTESWGPAGPGPAGSEIVGARVPSAAHEDRTVGTSGAVATPPVRKPMPRPPGAPPQRRPAATPPRSRSGESEGPALVASQQPFVAEGPDDPRVVPEQPGGVAARLWAEVAAMDDEALELEAREVAGTISTAEARLAVLLAEIGRRQIPGRWECATVGRYASWQLQLSPTRARQLSELGEGIAALPTLAEAVCDGTLSADKAHAVVRAAEPSTEAALVGLAVQATTAQTQRLCARWRRHQADNPELLDPGSASERAAELAYQPSVVVDVDEHGVTLVARFDHVDGALVLASLDETTQQVRDERRSAAPIEGPPPAGVPASVDEVPAERLTQAQWRGHGLVRMARHTDDHAPRAGLPRRPNTQAVLHVGVSDMLDDGARPAAERPLDPASTRYPDSSHRPHPASPGDRRQATTDGADRGPDDDTNGERTSGGPPGPATAGHPGHPPGPTPPPLPRANFPELDPLGVHVHRDLARFLACDAGLLTVIDDDDGNPLHVGAPNTAIPRSARRAMEIRDRTCRWPGCVSPVIHAHHRQHRARHGGHDPENLVALCHHHHRTVHVHRVTIRSAPDGALRFLRSNGTEITAAPHPLDGEVVVPDATRAPMRCSPATSRAAPTRPNPPGGPAGWATLSNSPTPSTR